MSNQIEKWVESGMDPGSCPEIPGDPDERTEFLSTLTGYLAGLTETGIESVMGNFTRALGERIPGIEIAEALDIAALNARSVRVTLLLGELGVDSLIADDNYSPAITRLDGLIKIAAGSDDTEELSILFNYRGVCYYRLAKYPKASSDLEESLRLADTIDSDRRRARARINLGLVFKETGRLEDAAGHYKIALKLAREIADDRTVLSCYLNIGNIYRELKRWNDGRTALMKGIELAGELGDTTEEIRGRLNLGVLYLEEGISLDKARQLFEGVVGVTGDDFLGGIARNNLALTLVKLGEPERSLPHSQKSLEDAIKETDSEGIWRARANIARAYADLGKSEEALDCFKTAIEEFERLRGSLVSDRDRSEFRRNLRNLQGEYIKFCLDQLGTNNAFATLAGSKQRALKNLIEKRYPGQVKSDGELFNQILARLEDTGKAAIVDYFLHDDSLRIFVCDRDGVSIHESKGSISDIEGLLNDFSSEVNLFIASREFRENEWEKDADPPLGKLAEILLKPAWEKLRGYEHLYIVPQGILHQVPFAALHVEDKYLIETHSISILPSSDFLVINRRPYESEFGKISVIRGQSDDLPGTDLEIEELNGIFKGKLTIATSDILNGPVKAQILHFAGHAEFDRSDPYSSALILPGSERLNVSDLMNGGMDLGNVDLVTLSACETGTGKTIAGDELVGISRAFLASGAGSVLVSLWKVSDLVTSHLIRSFYLQSNKGIPYSKALQSAIINMLDRKRAHPYFFAPFYITTLGAGV